MLAANTASNGGAVSAGNNARIVINGGIISGNTSTGAVANQRNGGGGIYCTGNAKITLQAGYLTNNSANSAEYFDGGGAVLLGGNASFTISGGYVTANKAQGGGGIGTSFQQSSTVTMSGGHVSANYSFAAEGGGITVEQSSIGNITGGYITNNVAKTTHWGGGGLFCATASTLNLKNVLITENDAAGFGGGIAGCPTGKVYLYIDSGYAIFDNRDMVAEDSPHYVGAGVKQEDHQLCDNPVFLGNGHKDYFCALRSSVLGQMLGNVPVNWEGSADYIPVIIGPDGVQTAERIMGLTAHPSEVDKVTARSQANLFINGNYSDTHGGGILCNGDLIIGTPSDIEENANMTVWASKQLLGSSGEKLGVEMDQFLFELLDENMNRITTARNDENGLVIFDHAFHYNAAGTHTFFVRELVDQKNVDTEISYDSTLYRITVTVSETSIDWPDKDHHKISRIIEKIVIEKSTDGKNFTPCLTLNPNTSNYRLELLGNNPGFVNLKTENTKVTVRKEWPDSIGADSVTVYLLQNGKEIDRQILSAANQWTYTWSDLPVRDDNGIVYSYEVREAPVPGYDASITWQPDGTNSGGAYWIPMENGEQLKIGEQYLIVNADGNQALYVSANHQNNGFDATDKKAVTQHTEPLQIGGATYTRWYDASAIDPRCIFTAQEREYGNQNKGIILKCNGASADTWLLVQDNNNNYLKSTSGAQYASAFTFANGILKGQDNYNWNPNNLRTVIYSDNKFNTVTGTDNAAKVYRQVFGGSGGGWIVTISNTPAPEKLYDVNIEKVDTLDPSKVLPGAQFNLLCGDDALRFTLSGGVYRCDPNGEFTELITDENGILQITGLPEGSYTLREVKAPDGYQLAGDRAFSLPDSDGNSVLTLVVQDMPFTYVLPETGGIGNLPFIVTGILLLCGAVLLAVKKRMRYA